MPLFRFFSRIFARIFFGFRIHNAEVLKTPGPVLLIPNHLSWFDWWIVGICLDEDWKFMVSSTRADSHWVFRFVMRNRFTFPVDNNSPFAVKEMAKFLQDGGRMVLFAEGRLSETGSLMKLFEGTGFLLEKTDAKIITCYQRNAQRLPYSPNPSWKKIFPKLSVHFSDPITPPKTLTQRADVRGAYTQWLREQLMKIQFESEMEVGPQDLLTASATVARERPKTIILEDITGKRLPHRMVMVGAEVLAGRFSKLLNPDDERIGVLLPNVNATPVTILAFWRIGKVPAILNYTTGTPMMQTCSELAGLKQIVTSRAFLEKAALDIEPMKEAGIEFIYLEDVREQVSGLAKLTILLKHKAALGQAQFNIPTEQTAVVLFTSGSRASPRGGADPPQHPRQPAPSTGHGGHHGHGQHLQLPADVSQLWARGGHVVAAVPRIADDNFRLHCNTASSQTPFTTPTRRCFSAPTPSSTVTPRKPTRTISAACATCSPGRKRCNRPHRTCGRAGSGCTSPRRTALPSAPAISANTKADNRFGSVGRLLPGIECKLEPVDGVEDAGRLFVKGPNIMKGYLTRTPTTRFRLSTAGTTPGTCPRGRRRLPLDSRPAKRFAKVSGEMVSLTAVEDALAGAFPHYGEDCEIAVVAVTDADKGEKLIAVSTEPKLKPTEIRDAVAAAGLSNLCAPREIRILKEIPKLGTGKLNHREVQRIVEEGEA